ncbi:MAG: transposase [Bacteroidota bacterium]
MTLEEGKYYHLYNRSNNFEKLFRNHGNYEYFLNKFMVYLKPNVDVLAYCLMPTHFHFLIKVRENKEMQVQKKIGLLLSSYTKAINKRHSRQGSLFQPHSKAKEVFDERYLLTLISYIHQNPIRSKLVARFSDWKYSSYREICELNDDSIVTSEFYKQYFSSAYEFKKYSEETIQSIRKEYWT